MKNLQMEMLLLSIIISPIFKCKEEESSIFELGTKTDYSQSLKNCSKFVNNLEIQLAIKQRKNIYLEPILHRCLHERDYDSILLPLLAENEIRPLIVQVQFAIDKLMEVQNEGRLSLMTTIYIYWNDPHYTWDFNEIPINFTRYSLAKIWHPVFEIANCLTDTCILNPKNASLANVAYTGEIFYKITQRIDTSCDLHLKYFPFDFQNCKVILINTNYYIPEVIIEKYSEGFFYFKAESEEWEIVKIKDYASNFTGFSFKRTNNGFWDLENTLEAGWPVPGFVVELKIHRLARFYVYNIIAPVILLSLIGFFSVLLPDNSSDKINVAVTVLLGFLFIQGIVATLIPKSDNSPNLANYILFSLILSALDLLSSILVVGLSHKDENITPPLVVRGIFISLGFLVGDQDSVKKICRFFSKNLFNSNKTNDTSNKKKINNSGIIEENKVNKYEVNKQINDLLNQSVELRKTESWQDISRVLHRIFSISYASGTVLIFVCFLIPLFLNNYNFSND